MRTRSFKTQLASFFAALLLLATSHNPVMAQSPIPPNNKFGIHLAQPHFEDLEASRELLNSNGGDWGYVTLVVQENDRDVGKWQEIFDRMRRLHLIPIVRLATVPQGAKWKRPDESEASSWADFLNSLHWVVKDRYVILFNEPNHGSEWGGTVDSANYAVVSVAFAKKLKEKNKDFFVMLGGLDASAPQGLPNYEDEGNFLEEFFRTVTPDQFSDLFSGWSSHSYPNPAFAGSPEGAGRGSIRTYQWELQTLADIGVKKTLPVFITETGWDHAQVGLDRSATNFRLSYEDVWLPDDRVVAVTPFVLDYQGDPFLNFSWKLPVGTSLDERPFYPQYYTVLGLEKVKGEPVQIEKGSLDFDSPKELVGHSSYHFLVHLSNLGQAVWDKDFGYSMSLSNSNGNQFEYFFSDLRDIRPKEETDVDLYIKTNGSLGKRTMNIALQKNNKPILNAPIWKFEIFPLPSLSVHVSNFPTLSFNGSDFEIQIFNNKEELVYKKKNIKVVNGDGFISEIQNIALGRKYRMVILKKGYLPRQTFVSFKKGNNAVKFKIMLPFDFNGDGKFDLNDLGAVFIK